MDEPKQKGKRSCAGCLGLILLSLVGSLCCLAALGELGSTEAPTTQPALEQGSLVPAFPGGQEAEADLVVPIPAPARAPVRPTPAPLNGTVTVEFEGELIPGAVEVVCVDGFRSRSVLDAGVVAITEVPTSGDCKLYPKSAGGSFVAVQGGDSYRCTITGTTTSCE